MTAQTAQPPGCASSSNTTIAADSACSASTQFGECGSSSLLTQTSSGATPKRSHISPNLTPVSLSVGCQAARVEVEGGPADLQYVQKYQPMRPDGTVS